MPGVQIALPRHRVRALRQRRFRYAQRQGRQAEAARSQDFRRFTVTLDSSRCESGKSTGTSSRHVTSTSITRPLPAPHFIAVSPSIPTCKAWNTITSGIAVSVAKANATLPFLMAVALRPRDGRNADRQARLVAVGLLSEGRNVATEYRWAGRQEPAAALRWKRDGHQSLRQCEPASDVLIRLIIRAIADYAAETTERWVALGSRRGSHGEERRHPPLNIRRSCSAVSAPRCQAGVPPPFCSHGYERAFPEPNPVRRLAGTSRPAIQRDGGATQRK